MDRMMLLGYVTSVEHGDEVDGDEIEEFARAFLHVELRRFGVQNARVRGRAVG